MGNKKRNAFAWGGGTRTTKRIAPKREYITGVRGMQEVLKK